MRSEVYGEVNELKERLGVEKRRIYEVFSVLEGADLVQKVTKNRFKWIKIQEVQEVVEVEEVSQEDINFVAQFDEVLKETCKRNESI